ncbi:MAG: sensor histidine kinase [Lachnospiraceae bacterium]
MKFLKGRKNSLSVQMILSFLLIVVIAVISFMIISINRSGRATKETSVEYTIQLNQMMNRNIEFYIENMENISQIVTRNSDVRNYLLEDEGEEEYLTKVEEQFTTLKEARTDIYNIGVLGMNGKYLINDRNVEINPNAQWVSLDWYNMALKGKDTIYSSHVQNIVYKEYPWVITLSKTIKWNNKTIGVFFVDLNYLAISDLAEEINLGQKGYVYIVDSDGEIIYHPKQQLIYSGLWEEELLPENQKDNQSSSWESNNKLYTGIKSEVTGWTVVGVVDMDDILSGTEDMSSMYYLLAVCLIGVAMLLAVFLTDRITLPIRRLQEVMQEVETGNFKVDMIEAKSQDEIGDLIRTFHIMIQEIENLIERNNMEQEEKRKSELNALQAQINPHFLYNTLDSIIWMAEDGNTRDVVLMTSALSKLLRKSISNPNKLITVSEELEYTRSYLTIQEMRYKGKLKYSIDIEPGIADMEIIKLIVQPLVENAIYHGIKYKEGIGTIIVEAGYREQDIIIKVIDDGNGMTADQLAHIFDERETDKRTNSVGVRNVHKRIQLYYGVEYGLDFISKLGSGTIATIHLPVQTGGRDEDQK